MTPSPVWPIRFGVFEIDPRRDELRKQGLKVKLGQEAVLPLAGEPADSELESLSNRIVEKGSEARIRESIGCVVGCSRSRYARTSRSVRLQELALFCARNSVTSFSSGYIA
jgi:hypothetical protein